MKTKHIKYVKNILFFILLFLFSNCKNKKETKINDYLTESDIIILDEESKIKDTMVLINLSNKLNTIPNKTREKINNIINTKIALVQNKNASALFFLAQVKEKQGNDKLLEALILQNYGYIMRSSNQVDSAGYYFFTSLKIKKNNEFNFLLGNSYYNYGFYLFRKELFNEAIINCHQAIKHTKKNINPYYYNLIGNCYYSLEMDDSAQKYYSIGVETAQKNNDSSVYIDIKSNLNNLFTIQRKFDTAIVNFNELYDYFNTKNEKYQKAAVLANLGSIFIYKNNFDSASYYLSESNKIASENNYYDILKSNYELLSSLYLAKDNYIKAYQHLKTKQLYEDSLKENKNKNFVKELEVKYKNDEQINTINLQKVELEKKNLQKGIAIIIALLILVMSIIIILIYQRRIKAEKNLHILEVNSMLKESEDKIFKSLFEGREKERVKLSEELHDGIGSQLALCKMQLSMFTAQNIDDTKIDAITKLVDKVSKDVRSLSHQMNTGNTFGLNISEAINELCEEINKTGLIQINYSQTGEKVFLDETRNINIYRIVQEIINNTLKHAKAKEINLHLHHDDLKISILIEDNGVGFNPKLKAEGIGLKNIKSRIKELNGELTIDSTIGMGTTTIIDIPRKINKHI